MSENPDQSDPSINRIRSSAGWRRAAPIVEWWLLPNNARWRQISKSLYLIYVVAAVPLYLLGLRTRWSTLAVYYLWKFNVFGFFFGDVPYSCGVSETPSAYELCFWNYGAGSLSIPSGPVWYGFHLLGFLMYLVGGIFSVRIVAICVASLEGALGVDFISRLIDKFLPASKAADRSASETGKPNKGDAPPADTSKGK